MIFPVNNRITTQCGYTHHHRSLLFGPNKKNNSQALPHLSSFSDLNKKVALFILFIYQNQISTFLYLK